MAFTGNWIWGDRSRTLDVNVDSGGTQTARNNWVFSRYRMTNVEYDTELGDEEESVSAYVGETLLEEKTSPLNYATFDTTQNWTDLTYKYYENYSAGFSGTAGVTRYAFEIGSDYTNKPISAKTTIVRPFGGNDGATFWQWEVGEWDVGDDDWQNLLNTTTNYIRSPKKYQDFISSINATVFSTATGTFSGSSTGSVAGFPKAVDFYCSNDNRVSTPGVDWHKETQTWIYKDEYQ